VLGSLLDGLKTQDPDRAQHIQTVFLPKYRQEELGALLQEATLSDRQRNLLFDWYVKVVLQKRLAKV